MTMDCQQLRDQLDSIALQPQDRLATDLREHIDQCQACREEFSQLQATWAMLPASLPDETVSDDLEARVMNRVKNAPQPARDYSTQAVFWKYAVAASVLFALVSLTLLRPGILGGGQPQLTDSDVAKMRAIAEQSEKLDELKNVFASPTVKYVSLTSPQRSNGPSGFLVHDETSQQAHFFGKNLVADKENSLRVWLLDDNDSVLSSAEVEPPKASRVSIALLPLISSANVRTLVVTRESGAATPEVPSTNVVIRCDIQF